MNGTVSFCTTWRSASHYISYSMGEVLLQGYLSGGDAYKCRYNEIIINIPRKTKCVNNSVLWDEVFADLWLFMIDYLWLMGTNFVVLTITQSEIKPHEKFIKAIRNFPVNYQCAIMV